MENMLRNITLTGVLLVSVSINGHAMEQKFKLLTGHTLSDQVTKKNHLLCSILHPMFLQTVLHEAAQQGNYEQAWSLLTQKKTNVNQTDVSDSTALHHAASKGNKKIILLLLLSNANIDHANLNGCTPLHFASRNGKIEAVELLLKHKANVSIKADYTGNTPLMLAAENGHLEVVKILLKKDQSMINEQNNRGMTAAHFAASSKHRAIFTYLKSHGSNMTLKNEYGETPSDLLN